MAPWYRYEMTNHNVRRGIAAVVPIRLSGLAYGTNILSIRCHSLTATYAVGLRMERAAEAARSEKIVRRGISRALPNWSNRMKCLSLS